MLLSSPPIFVPSNDDLQALSSDYWPPGNKNWEWNPQPGGLTHDQPTGGLFLSYHLLSPSSSSSAFCAVSDEDGPYPDSCSQPIFIQSCSVLGLCIQ